MHLGIFEQPAENDFFSNLLEAGCPKINLQIRTSNHGVIEFYRHLGYSVDDVVSMGKRLEHDDQGVF